MAYNEPSSNNPVPEDVWARALAEFELCLQASTDGQQAICDRLNHEEPAVAAALHRLLRRHAAELPSEGQADLNIPALQQIETLVAEPVAYGPGLSATVHRDLRHNSTFTRFFLTAALCSLLLYCWVATTMVRFGDQGPSEGWDANWSGGPFLVTGVDPKGPAAGKLYPGDRITAINGDPQQLFPALFGLPVNDSLAYTVRVDRGGHLFNLSLHEDRVRVPHRLVQHLTFFFVSLVFFIVAVAIALLKPDQKVPQLASFALWAEALVLLGVCPSPYREFLPLRERWLLNLVVLTSGIHFALAYHFYAAFFADLLRSASRKPILWLLYPWGILATCSVQFKFGLFRFPFLLARPQILLYTFFAADSFYVFAPALICLLITLQYLKVRKEPGRLRARWIAFGSLVGILPYTLYRLLLLGLTWSKLHLSPTLLEALFVASILAALAIPFCSAYAVLRYRLFEIRVFIRRGLQYVMLSRGWWALPALPLASMLLILLHNWNRTVGEATGQNALFLFLALVFTTLLAFHNRVRVWLDKRFARDATQRVERLRALLFELRRCTSLEALAASAIRYLPSIGYDLVTLIGFEDPVDHSFSVQGEQLYASSPLRLSAQSPVVAALERAGVPQYLEEIRAATRPGPELDQLAQSGIDLAVPIVSSKHRASGILLLGSSREGYTAAQLADLVLAAEEIASVVERLQSESRVKLADVPTPVPLLLECPTCGLCFDHPAICCPSDNSKLDATFRFSRLLVHRYSLIQRLGTGGMGTVYQAYDERLKRKVAVKIIAPPTGHNSNTWSERAHREALALAQLDHPNIVKDHDFGTFEDGTAYIVMEFVAGMTLRKLLPKGPVSRATVALWFDQMLDGLAAAHKAGIIHRDLKPENLLIAESDFGRTVLKIVDFGIAKIVGGDDGGPSLTLTGFRLGTPFYMSPEQLDDDLLDERSDLFSAGLILLEVLLGELPFKKMPDRKRFLSWLQVEGALPVSTESDLLLNQALQKCLAINPDHRYRSASEMRREIVPLIPLYQGRRPSDSAGLAASV